MLDADRPRRQTQEPESPPPIAGRSLQPLQLTPDSATSHAASEALSGAESLEDRGSGPNAGSDTPKVVLSMLAGHPIRAYSNLGPGKAEVEVVPQAQEPPPAEAPGSAEAQQEAGLGIGQQQQQAATTAAEAWQQAPAHAESADSLWASVEDTGKATAAAGGHVTAELREDPAVEGEAVAPDASQTPDAAATATAAQKLAEQEREGREVLHYKQQHDRQTAEVEKDVPTEEVGCSKCAHSPHPCRRVLTAVFWMTMACCLLAARKARSMGGRDRIGPGSIKCKRVAVRKHNGTALQDLPQDARSFWLAREASAVNWTLKRQQSPSGRAVQPGGARASKGHSAVVVSCTSSPLPHSGRGLQGAGGAATANKPQGGIL